jgi:hypothetical protein
MIPLKKNFAVINFFIFFDSTTFSDRYLCLKDSDKRLDMILIIMMEIMNDRNGMMKGAFTNKNQTRLK